MDLLIRLEPDLERSLEREATRLGVNPGEAAAQVLSDSLVSDNRSSVLAVLDEIEREDATDDPAELARRQTEWETLKIALDEDRLSSRPLFPNP